MHDGVRELRILTRLQVSSYLVRAVRKVHSNDVESSIAKLCDHLDTVRSWAFSSVSSRETTAVFIK